MRLFFSLLKKKVGGQSGWIWLCIQVAVPLFFDLSSTRTYTLHNKHTNTYTHTARHTYIHKHKHTNTYTHTHTITMHSCKLILQGQDFCKEADSLFLCESNSRHEVAQFIYLPWSRKKER